MKTKVCLMITGQMRSYKKAFQNILNNIIHHNKDFEFDIYIQTEFYNNIGGTKKNEYYNEEKTIIEFEKQIKSTYNGYVKFISIENEVNKLSYPNFINNYGPWICLYRNKVLFDNIKNKEQYKWFIRMRPDISLTHKLNLDLLKNVSKQIYIFSGNIVRYNSWLHNRDWDHLCISDYNGMKLWTDYYKFLEYYPPYKFDFVIKFNNVGYWVKNEKKDRSVICTQLFFKYLKDNNYNLYFDTLSIFTIVLR